MVPWCSKTTGYGTITVAVKIVCTKPWKIVNIGADMGQVNVKV